MRSLALLLVRLGTARVGEEQEEEATERADGDEERDGDEDLYLLACIIRSVTEGNHYSLVFANEVKQL